MVKQDRRPPGAPAKPLTVDKLFQEITPDLDQVADSRQNQSGYFVSPTMQRATIILDALMDVFYDFKRDRYLSTRESAGTVLPNDVTIPEHTPEIARKNIFKRTANEILESGFTVGGGCMDMCTVFIPLAKRAGMAVTRIVEAASARQSREFGGEQMNIPHTIIEIRDPDDPENPVKMIDPMWARNPRFPRQLRNRWESEGLARVSTRGLDVAVVSRDGIKQRRVLSNPPASLEAWERHTPRRGKDAWIWIRDIDSLPSPTFDTGKRRKLIRETFSPDSRMFS